LDCAVLSDDLEAVKALYAYEKRIKHPQDSRKDQIVIVEGNTASLANRNNKIPGALGLAVLSGNQEIVAYLLRNDMGLFVSYSDPNAPLHLAIDKGDTEMVKILTSKFGINFTPNNLTITTVLNHAVKTNNIDIVKILLDRGAGESINIIDYEGKNALGYAMENRNGAMYRLLLQYGAIPRQ
jgi:ankyrin repeat protein